jgi:hypothetical protein
MFRTFDYPNPDVSSAQRFATTVPQQALFMMNSPFAQEQARRLMARPDVKAARDDSARVQAIYRVLYQRSADAEELELAREFLHRPATAAETAPIASTGWQYGHGRFDEDAGRVRDFKVMNVRKETRVTPAETYPHAEFGHVSITATGGHPGPTTDLASIRRWIVPGTGKVKIEGTLAHGNEKGDGVRGRIISSEGGRYAEWTVHNKSVETKMELNVQGGETLDFAVDCGTNATADSYTWTPVIVFTPHADAEDMTVRTWNAKKDFENPVKPRARLTRWEELAQVLLLSNELAFVD